MGGSKKQAVTMPKLERRTREFERRQSWNQIEFPWHDQPKDH